MLRSGKRSLPLSLSQELVAYTWYTRKQWRSFETSVRDNKNSFAQTLRHMQIQALAQQDAALGQEYAALAAINAADAMREQVNQAKEALHVSERAYLALESPIWDMADKICTMAVDNNGRLPSGKTMIFIHEATLHLDPLSPRQIIEESHWHHETVATVQTGTRLFAVGIRTPKLELWPIQNNYQSIVIAGTISYVDGFHDDPAQHWDFCWQTRYNELYKTVTSIPCDPDTILPEMISKDGYPNKESSY
jgi:hypothetical protein